MSRGVFVVGVVILWWSEVSVSRAEANQMWRGVGDGVWYDGDISMPILHLGLSPVTNRPPCGASSIVRMCCVCVCATADAPSKTLCLTSCRSGCQDQD